MDQIDLAPLTLRFLARVQLLRESTQFFRSALRLPHDTNGAASAMTMIEAIRRLR
jgi:hypothetical protein